VVQLTFVQSRSMILIVDALDLKFPHNTKSAAKKLFAPLPVIVNNPLSTDLI